MTVARHGNRLGFWDGVTTYNSSTNPGGGVAVPMGGVSAPQQIGRTGNTLAVYLQVAAGTAFATVWQLQVAHSGGMNDSKGEPVDEDLFQASIGGLVWHDAWYYGMTPTSAPFGTQGATNLQFWIPTGGAAICSTAPDWVAGWVRIARVDAVNTAVTVAAGWEAESE